MVASLQIRDDAQHPREREQSVLVDDTYPSHDENDRIASLRAGREGYIQLIQGALASDLGGVSDLGAAISLIEGFNDQNFHLTEPTIDGLENGVVLKVGSYRLWFERTLNSARFYLQDENGQPVLPPAN